MHFTTRYVYLLYWYLRSQGMNDAQISLNSGLSHQTMTRLRNKELVGFQYKTMKPLEDLVVFVMDN